MDVVTGVKEDDRENGVGTSLVEFSDIDLIEKADYFYSQEQYFKASSCLESVKDKSLLSPIHNWILKFSRHAHCNMKEGKIQSNVDILKDNGYKKQHQLHKSNCDVTSVHYKVSPNDYSVTSRVESVISADLLIPIMAVLNESDLYATWLPRMTFPFKMGLSDTKRLGEYGRGHQIVSCTIMLPFPISNREVVLHAVAVDTIDEDNAIFIQISSLNPGTYFDKTVVEEPKKGVVRVDLDAGLLIRACPSDHPLLLERNAMQRKPGNAMRSEASTIHSSVDNSNTNDDESLLLITMILKIDYHLQYIPVRLVNFFMWFKLLSVAEEVRTGKRPDITQIINEKEELYGWIQRRVNVLLDNMRHQVEDK